MDLPFWMMSILVIGVVFGLFAGILYLFYKWVLAVREVDYIKVALLPLSYFVLLVFYWNDQADRRSRVEAVEDFLLSFVYWSDQTKGSSVVAVEEGINQIAMLTYDPQALDPHFMLPYIVGLLVAALVYWGLVSDWFSNLNRLKRKHPNSWEQLLRERSQYDGTD